MQLNPNRLPSVYDELVTFYPDFYRDVREMQAILRAEGAIADGLVQAIDIIIDNNFILTAHADLIERMEQFFEITPFTDNLEERRQTLLSYFIGFGHVSATMIKALIKAFTQEDSSVSFNMKDANDNYILQIEIKKKHGVNPNWENVYNLLDKRIPAHIQMSRVLIYPAPNIPLVVGIDIHSKDTIGVVTVPDFDFSTITVLTMPNGDWLTTPDGDILFYTERTDL